MIAGSHIEPEATELHANAHKIVGGKRGNTASNKKLWQKPVLKACIHIEPAAFFVLQLGADEKFIAGIVTHAKSVAAGQALFFFRLAPRRSDWVVGVHTGVNFLRQVKHDSDAAGKCVAVAVNPGLVQGTVVERYAQVNFAAQFAAIGQLQLGLVLQIEAKITAMQSKTALAYGYAKASGVKIKIVLQKPTLGIQRHTGRGQLRQCGGVVAGGIHIHKLGGIGTQAEVARPNGLANTLAQAIDNQANTQQRGKCNLFQSR